MSNKDILLDTIGETDPELIPDISFPKKKRRGIKWAAVGAGICAAAVIACIVILPKGGKEPGNISPYSGFSQSSENKKAGSDKISPDLEYGGMGFEGLMAYDISELDTPNPWSVDSDITELPVYKNLAYTTGIEISQIPVYLTEEQMTKIAENTALSLNTDITQTETERVGDITSSASDEFFDCIYRLVAECSDRTEITVYGDGQIKISFEKVSSEEKKLPDGYSFTYSNTTGEEAEATLKYLSEKYSALLGFDEPVCYSYADRTYYGEESRSYYVYDRSGDTVRDILNFNLYNAQFCPDDSGNLYIIWLNNAFCASEYRGDYPIISADDARALLLDGSYYTSVPEEYLIGGSISEENIAKCELTYRTYHAKYYQPYYEFYVELDTSLFELPDGLNNYGIFYVPAVEAGYLEETDKTLPFN